MSSTTLNTSTTRKDRKPKANTARQNLQGNSHGEAEGEKKDVYSVITDRILAHLENGVIPWQKPWRAGEAFWPKNMVSGKRYNGINAFLLAMTDFKSPFFLTFKQARDLGGTIKKGSKGLPVIYCNKVQGKEADAEKGETESRGYSFLRYYTVFNIEQTEGIEIPAAASPIATLAFSPLEACERICSAYRGAPDVVFRAQRACYSPALDMINMPDKETFLSVEKYYSTLFHEYTHSTGHKNRLAREGIIEGHKFGDEIYSKEELIAEMGSAFLCAHANIAPVTLKNSSAYISNWLSKLRNDKRLVIQAAAAAQKAAHLILGPLAAEGAE